jgi:nucleotide-binding universal stress UspA family protein
MLSTPDTRTPREHPIVACDAHPEGDAVDLGARLAGVVGQPLVLAGVARDNRVAVGADVDVRRSVIPTTRIVDGLIDLARDIDASMIVIGRATEEHVTRSLVPRAPCPVVVAAGNLAVAQGAAIARIGIAYDGSPQAQWALVAAMRLADVTGAALVAVAVGPTPERAETVLQIARLLLGRATQTVESHAVLGDPREELVAASSGVDLMVCGSRGRGRPASALLGSVSARLVAHAHCPVLVVPPSVGGNPAGPLGVSSAGAHL